MPYTQDYFNLMNVWRQLVKKGLFVVVFFNESWKKGNCDDGNAIEVILVAWYYSFLYNCMQILQWVLLRVDVS